MKKSLFPEVLVRCRKEKGLNQQELADFLGVSKATISDYERGKSDPPLTNLLIMSDIFQLSLDDLVHPIRKNADKEKHSNVHLNVHPSVHLNTVQLVPKVVTVDREGQDNIMFVPTRARAGYLAGHADPEYIKSLPSYRMPGFNNGHFRMFEVQGHSMIPTFNESDIIVTRFEESFANIRDERVYVVVTQRDGILVKRVLNRVQPDGKLILKSDNQRHLGDYPPIIISPEEVVELWYAVAYMSRQMRAPGEIYNRLIDLEGRLTLLEHSRNEGA